MLGSRLAAALAGAAMLGLTVGSTVTARSETPAPTARAVVGSTHTQTLVLPWKVDFRMRDIGPEGASSGDTIQAEFTLTGRRSGTADFACTAVGIRYVCQGIIRLEQGDIYAQTGPIEETDPAAIVGGTRAFAGVTGQFTQRENEDGTGGWKLFLKR